MDEIPRDPKRFTKASQRKIPSGMIRPGPKGAALKSWTQMWGENVSETEMFDCGNDVLIIEISRFHSAYSATSYFHCSFWAIFPGSSRHV